MPMKSRQINVEEREMTTAGQRKRWRRIQAVVAFLVLVMETSGISFVTDEFGSAIIASLEIIDVNVIIA